MSSLNRKATVTEPLVVFKSVVMGPSELSVQDEALQVFFNCGHCVRAIIQHGTELPKKITCPECETEQEIYAFVGIPKEELGGVMLGMYDSVEQETEMKVPLERSFFGFIIGTPLLRWIFIALILLVVGLHVIR